MKTGKHDRNEKTDSSENAKKEERHTIRKVTGAWQKDTQKTFEGHMIWQRFAKKKKGQQRQKKKQQNGGKENIRKRSHQERRQEFQHRDYQHRDSR